MHIVKRVSVADTQNWNPDEVGRFIAAVVNLYAERVFSFEQKFREICDGIRRRRLTFFHNAVGVGCRKRVKIRAVHVRTGYFSAVDIRNESVVAVHVQHHLSDAFYMFYGESFTNKNRTCVLYGRYNVCFAVANRSFSFIPLRVVERRRCPSRNGFFGNHIRKHIAVIHNRGPLCHVGIFFFRFKKHVTVCR